VNPNQAGCGFPSKHLAAWAWIFYVMLALRPSFVAAALSRRHPSPTSPPSSTS
jgi:single-stranded-DNA-specific exonuclease